MFTARSDSPAGAPDQVVDFFRSEGDRIDLSGIDAREGIGGNQAFSFNSGAAFSAGGRLRTTQSPYGSWLVEGDTDADLQAEVQILIGFAQQMPVAGDFIP